MSIKFIANSNILVIGSSGSGKTTAVLRIVREKLIDPMPSKIFYLYGAYQEEFENWQKDKSNPPITFVKGLDLSVIDKYKGPKLLICDDLILELNRALAQHFIAGSSHKNTTTIFISHSLFLNNELYRLISNNSQYLLLFKNKRNFSQVARLGRQILGTRQELLLSAYKYVKPFDFVLLSFHPLVPEELLVTTDYFEQCPSVFT
jgi:DNA replication protein DnaC